MPCHYLSYILLPTYFFITLDITLKNWGETETCNHCFQSFNVRRCHHNLYGTVIYGSSCSITTYIAFFYCSLRCVSDGFVSTQAIILYTSNSKPRFYLSHFVHIWNFMWLYTMCKGDTDFPSSIRWRATVIIIAIFLLSHCQIIQFSNVTKFDSIILTYYFSLN